MFDDLQNANQVSVGDGVLANDLISLVPPDLDMHLLACELFVHGSPQPDSTLALSQALSQTIRLPGKVSKVNANTPLVTTSLRRSSRL